ncbi:oligosaccharide flippase family protein [Roseobacter sp. N2S]|uniref:oligosaccharide flippase family protein n=1 Tax=Roseobacter sp. N2S TaxID=2663844 RepID=UPI0028658D17|nr:oligosaccharide flippase family protein [Roseobacter sp. N2S]MDR6267655.1 O-antigen/teichoic acid export membrane protein [Roseobacter sp. N2S]
MFRTALLILSGNAAAALLLLVRNLLVARLIPVADYGIAATFAIAMAVVEMMSQLGLQQQIVQAKDGEGQRFQAALQGFQVLRGVVAGVALFVLAGPLADFLNIPQAAWAYRVMALVPVLNALTHFDIHRLNRSMVFWPVILTGAMPALLSLIALWPLVIFYGDYKVMLYAIIVQAMMTAVTSHFVAQRPYRLILDRAIMVQSLRFGWPLLVNGILLFGVFQGDKLIVGRELGIETLAIFAMGFTLTLTPTLVMAKSVQSFFLPQLSAVDRKTDTGRVQLQFLAMVIMQISLVMGILLVIAVFLLGGPLVQSLLGPKYLPLVPLLVPLAIMQALRVAKTGSAVVALACGHTSNMMQANLIRIATLPLAWYAVSQGANVPIVIAIAIAGEAMGYVLSLVLVAHKPGVFLRPMRAPILFSAIFLGCAVWTSFYEYLSSGMAGGLLLLLLVVAFAFMKETRQYITIRHNRL